MRWDSAPLQRKLLGGIWLLVPLCFFRYGIEIGAGLMIAAGACFPFPRYPYPRKQGIPSLRIFFAGSACFFLLSFFQYALERMGAFFFATTYLYAILSRMTALFFALPMGIRALSLRIQKTPAILCGGAMLFLGLFFMLAGR